MEEIKNIFYLNLNEDKQKDFNILFLNKDNFVQKTIEEFNKKLKKFIELQKNNEEIDLSYVCFHEFYNFLDKNSSFTKILIELNFLEHYEDIVECGNSKKEKQKKIWTKINKAFNFGNAIFYKRVEFIRTIFEKQINFEGATFESDINFENSKFIYKNNIDDKPEINFEGIICKKEAIFNCAEFFHKVSFFRARFYDYSSFKDATFYDEVDFENTVSKDIFFFHNVKLGKISLIGSHLENANFLRLKDRSKKILQKENFQNKDSVRLVKAQYEKENNTTEVNWSFPLEQEFYLDLLNKDRPYYPNKNVNKISLLIHKYVSNYGTDWVRVLIVLFAFGLIASLGYSFLDYCPENFSKETCEKYFINFSYNEKLILLFEFLYLIVIYIYYEHINKYNNKYGFEGLLFVLFVGYITLAYLYLGINNKVIALINPLNIFNHDMVYIAKDKVLKNINYFENIAWYGVFVKVITVSLMYQFVISFRNSTRRK